MFKELRASDINYKAFPVYKKWTFTESDIRPLFGIRGYSNFDSDTDINYNGVPKKLLYKTILRSYYFYGSRSNILDEVGFRTNYTSLERTLPTTTNVGIHTEDGSILTTDDSDTLYVTLPHEVAILPIPQVYIGEGIRRNTVLLHTDFGILYDDGNSNLIKSGSSDIWGNVFYDRGIIVLTRNIVSGSVLSTYTLTYSSTKTIYELEAMVTVEPGEFNVSQNPTALVSGSYVAHSGIQSKVDPTVYGGFDDYFASASVDPTGSYISPYITTIGLYDDDYQLIAVAKLPHPVKSMHDYPVNFLIRLDL